MEQVHKNGTLDTTPPPETWLFLFSFQNETGQDGPRGSYGIKWDRTLGQFVFVGDEEKIQPAARLFFDEVLAQAMDYFRPYLTKDGL